MEYVILLSNNTWRTFSSKDEVKDFALKEGKGLIKQIIQSTKQTKVDFEYVETFSLGGK